MRGQGGNRLMPLKRKIRTSTRRRRTRRRSTKLLLLKNKSHLCKKGTRRRKKERRRLERKPSLEMVTSSNYAGMRNTSYILLRRNDGYTFAKFVGTNYDNYAWTIWVTKTLVANSLGPIEKWGPKNKA